MMKIAVVGCGAVGSYYGAKLSQVGNVVHFLLRSDYEVVSRQGLQVQSPKGSFHFQPVCARKPEEIGIADLVLIALKTTANDQFPFLLPPLVGPETLLLTLQNGLGNEEQLAKLFLPTQILGALAFVCLNRIKPGFIHHIDHGAIVIGEYQRPPLPRTRQLAAMFRQAGVPCDVTPNLAQAHWEKLVWNIPFNGLGVAASAGLDAVTSGTLTKFRGPCLTTDKLLGDPAWAKLVHALMHEVVLTGRTLGFDISDSVMAKHLERTPSMGAYKPSSVLDFECGRPLELQSLFLEPLRQAQKAGIATPCLAAMCEVLRALEHEQEARRNVQRRRT